MNAMIMLPPPPPTPPLKCKHRKRRRQKGLERQRPSHFVKLLWRILDDGHSDVIKWTNEGERFKILNQERLAAEVLPHYFAHNNFASFQRQLNYFGFRRCQRTRPMVYAHTYFRRYRPELMQLISRSTNKKVIRTNELLEGCRPFPEKITEDDITAKQRYLSINEMLAEKGSASKKSSEVALPPSSSLFLLAKLATTAGAPVAEETNPADCEGKTLSLEDTRRSLPSTCVLRNPSDFHKSSAIDHHGVRFKESDGDGEKWRWKCRYCQQVLLVGHGAPNAHLKNVHCHVLSRANGLKRDESDGKHGCEQTAGGPALRTLSPTSVLTLGNNYRSTAMECGHDVEQTNPKRDLWELLESTKPDVIVPLPLQKKADKTYLWRLLKSTKPSSLPSISVD